MRFPVDAPSRSGLQRLPNISHPPTGSSSPNVTDLLEAGAIIIIEDFRYRVRRLPIVS
jgi:hypothetical protein